MRARIRFTTKHTKLGHEEHEAEPQAEKIGNLVQETFHSGGGFHWQALGVRKALFVDFVAELRVLRGKGGILSFTWIAFEEE